MDVRFVTELNDTDSSEFCESISRYSVAVIGHGKIMC